MMKVTVAHPASIHLLDIEELAMYLCGLSDDAEPSDIDDALLDKFNVDMDDFRSIASHLLPLIDVGISPLTGQRFKGFANVDAGTWLVKMEIPHKSKPRSPRTK